MNQQNWTLREVANVPPRVRGTAKGRSYLRMPRRGTLRDLVLAYMMDGHPRTDAEVAVALGMDRGQVSGALQGLKHDYGLVTQLDERAYQYTGTPVHPHNGEPRVETEPQVEMEVEPEAEPEEVEPIISTGTLLEVMVLRELNSEAWTVWVVSDAGAILTGTLVRNEAMLHNTEGA